MGKNIDIWPKLFTIFKCLILLPVPPLSEYASVWKAVDMMYIAIVWIFFIIIVTKGYGMFNYNIFFVSCSETLDLCLTWIFKTGDVCVIMIVEKPEKKILTSHTWFVIIIVLLVPIFTWTKYRIGLQIAYWNEWISATLFN